MAGKRSYRMAERARSQEETRLRIVEATMRLHETVGPKDTTITGIAREAGVQRLTVYRHFPNEAAVFAACTAHWLMLNPPPDGRLWAKAEGGEARVLAALEAWYDYYRQTAPMWRLAWRDVADVVTLQGPMTRFGEHLDILAAELAQEAGAATGNRRTQTIRHLLDFRTWSGLGEQGLDRDGRLALARDWLRGCRP